MKCQNEISSGKIMKELNEVSFAIDDMVLYLDTHPGDERAMNYCREMLARRQRLMEDYAQNFGPLTIDCADENNSSSWQWAEQPFPWEQKGGMR